MTEERKEYLIEIFLKKCNLQNTNKAQLDFLFKLNSTAYKVSEEKIAELKNKFNISEYTKRVTPIIDKHFSIEELEELIKFYSSGTGRKLLDHIFLNEIEEIGKNMRIQIEREFIINNGK